MKESSEFLRRLPKIQLHCHLEGTLRASTFLDLAKRHGVALTYEPGKSDVLPAEHIEYDRHPDDLYRFENFKQFLMTFAAVSRSLAVPEDYGRLALEYVQDALAQNVVHAELFISPSVWEFFHPGLDVRACVQAMREAFDTAKERIDIALIADVTRNFGHESAMRSARQAVELADLGIIGIGLGGDEAKFPAELFEDVFAFARRERLRAVAHAGEAAGAHSVHAAVKVLGAERIGHGVRALEDEGVVRMLAEQRIPLEICPTSNHLTGAAHAAKPHPFADLDASGCVITIDADDPALFRTTLTDEYAYVLKQSGREALERFVRNAVDASFASPERKAQLHRVLDGAGVEPPAARRTS